MLGAAPYYFQITRKMVIGFGSMFNGAVLVKYNANSREEISRRTVPLTYAGKENYIERLNALPTLPATVEMKLPSMSFELVGVKYNPARKTQSTLQNFNQTIPGQSIATQYVGVPYDLHMSLYIYIRNIDDGLQIVEQILPMFTPDYTITVNLIDEMDIVQNIPIILNDVSMSTNYEGDADSTERRLVWQLDFTMMATYYGPISTGGIITKTITNINNLVTATDSQITLVIATTPLGNLSLGETIYQGPSLAQANAVGVVDTWNPLGGQLIVTMTTGEFVANANVYGVNYGSTVNVISIPSEATFATINVTPMPANAVNVSEDFGFCTTITEYN